MEKIMTIWMFFISFLILIWIIFVSFLILLSKNSEKEIKEEVQCDENCPNIDTDSNYKCKNHEKRYGKSN